ncbi:Alpha/Beta hydrolase protein [Naematelia encephala]|uniref:Carboxypeptidase n=1 Tax=Naematelia encephala TaxID=71784 RepID=A0A1Y2BKM9_9TREE|nr:Alpha/Beta hydrolase protein [Naematelia encephala]
MRLSTCLLAATVLAVPAWARSTQQTVIPGPVDRLSSLQTGQDYVTVTSAHHPGHKVRIKSHKGWCEENAKSYTGYIDAADGKQLFFYFFESRSKPSEDDVVMWINGGPGGSSAMGLFMEQGPCRIKENPETPYDTYTNPYAWNEKANVFFLDQPVGVGFSHGENGQIITNTLDAAKDVASFIDIFFDTFKEYKGRPFHMTGESYGGRYLPVFASAVYDQNAKLLKQGREPVNLKSVMIGNGGTSLFKLIESSFEFACTKHVDLGRSVLEIGQCIQMAEAVPKCHKMLQKYCLDTSDYTSCRMWSQYCINFWTGTAALAEVNWYNVNQSCSAQEREEDRCLAGSSDVEQYLNLNATRKLLGVDDHIKKFELSSNKVNTDFHAALDFEHQTYYWVAQLLERGIKVLNYVGTLDAACDHIGQSKWMAEMPWTGQAAYLAAATEDWVVDGEVAGTFKTAGDLTLLKVYGAGHLVPTDKPKESLVLLNEWIESTRH